MKNKTFTELIKEEILEQIKSKEDFSFFVNSVSSIIGIRDKNVIKLRIMNSELRTQFIKKYKELLGIKLKEEKSNILIEDSEQEVITDIRDLILGTQHKTKICFSAAFFTRGYINRPNSSKYHLEIRVKKIYETIFIKELFLSIGVETKQFDKNGWTYIYIKKSNDISDTLKAFNCPTAATFFDAQKIEKDFSTAINRQNSIDVYNQQKIAEASYKHCEACRDILENKIKYNLSIMELRIAQLRLKYPEYPLIDLTIEYNSIFEDRKSKSTIARWLRNIVRQYDENK